MKKFSMTLMFGLLLTLAISASAMARPVSSPWPWMMRAWEWPPSRVVSISPSTRSKPAPHSSNCRTSSGPWRTTCSTVSVAQPAAGPQRVGDVRLERIVLAEHRGDAALGLPGVAVFEARLADDDDIALFGRLQGRPQTGDARADDHAIGEKLARRDRIDIDQVPPRLAELNPLGRHRPLCFSCSPILYATLHE